MFPDNTVDNNDRITNNNIPCKGFLGKVYVVCAKKIKPWHTTFYKETHEDTKKKKEGNK